MLGSYYEYISMKYAETLLCFAGRWWGELCVTFQDMKLVTSQVILEY